MTRSARSTPNPPMRSAPSLRIRHGPADELVDAPPVPEEAWILAGRELIARVRELVADRLDQPARPSAQHGDGRREVYGLVDVVRHEDDRLLEIAPQPEQEVLQSRASHRV